MQKNNRTILLLCPYPFGVAPSQRFRFEQYLALLEQHKFIVDFQPFLSTGGWRVLYSPGKSLQKLAFTLAGFVRRFALLFWAAPRADYIFIHREAAPLGPPVIEFIIARVLRKRLIYDFDDAIWLPKTSEENALIAGIKWHSKVKHICRWSYRVSVGNEFLGAYALKYCQRVTIVPTTVDTEQTHKPALPIVPIPIGIGTRVTNQLTTIGWTGSRSTLKYLKLIEPVLAELEKESAAGIRFVVIADRPPELKLKNLQFITWSKESEIEDLHQLDIGLMPLEDDQWSKGKCGLKAIQYMALGIPAVASDIGEASRIIDHGVTGFLCTTTETWLASLRFLIENPKQRVEMGQKAREKVVLHYSVASNTHNFLNLFNESEL
jgi:glycosyltransferase involved in cell wall biosynthesis